MLKNKFSWILVAAVAVLSLQNCEDPSTTFEPINPDLSESAVLGTSQSAKRTLDGCERQLAEVYNRFVDLVEVASDNYDNTRTFYNQFLDILNIQPTDADINGVQFEIARLRELANAGLTVIGPGDPAFAANDEAEFLFFLGVSHLLAGEVFQSLPATAGGAAMPAADHLNLAAGYFQQGLDKATEDDTRVSCTLARARALYHLGDKAGAVAAADAAIALNTSFLREVQYDVLNGAFVLNEMQNAIHDRGTFDDLQPLPRLDFLDPKYNDQNATKDFNTPLLKIEEAHLIKCEAAIADNQLEVAKGIMNDIIGLVATRPTTTFDDSTEDRIQGMPGIRPDSTNVQVAASPGAPLRSGLVLYRKGGPITVPYISGTSVTAAMIDAVGTADEALELLYLLRQEIFIAEGRRMTDMGVRLVVSEVERLANPNIKESDLTPVLPPFMDAIRTEIDGIDYDAATGICTIKHDLNKVIVANKASDFVCPFH